MTTYKTRQYNYGSSNDSIWPYGLLDPYKQSNSKNIENTNMYKQLLKDIYSAFQKFNRTRKDQKIKVGNAGVPSCGTGTLPGSECHKKLIFRHGTLEPNESKTVEVLAGRSGAFKPRTITIEAFDSLSNQPVFIEILDVTVMGNPQLVSYQGTTVIAERGSISFFNKTREIDWQVFGASAGQGLCLVFRNSTDRKVEVYVTVQGDRADSLLIGKA